MRKKTESILTVMNILAWIAFIGLMVKAGAILFNLVFSLVRPIGAKNVYNGLDLSTVRDFSIWQFFTTMSFMVAIPVMEALAALQVIKVLSKIKLKNPFTPEISKRLESISYLILGIWVVAMISNAHLKWLVKKIPGLEENFIPGEFIFLAGVVFVFAQIFKRGVEIQSENELTV